jgi:hypothetical protein
MMLSLTSYGRDGGQDRAPEHIADANFKGV